MDGWGERDEGAMIIKYMIGDDFINVSLLLIRL